jgi:hypothetical protein
MLRSPSGATIGAMMKTTGWQQHSVRGFLAGVVRKRLKLKLGSKTVDGHRVYRVSGGDQARFRDLVFPRQINLTSGRRAKRLHQYPACGGRGSGGRDRSKLRLFRPWFSAVRLPGSARTDQVLEDLWIRSALIVRRLCASRPSFARYRMDEQSEASQRRAIPG